MKGTPLGTSFSKNRITTAATVVATGALALGAITDEASASTLTVTKLAAAGNGSFLDAVRKANSDKDSDKIVFAKQLHGTIPIKKDVTFTSPVAIEGRGFGAPGPGFRRLVLKGSANGVTLSLNSNGRNLVAELALDHVAVESARELLKGETEGGTRRLDIRDSFITGHQDVNRPGVYIGGDYDGNNDLRLQNSTVNGFSGGVNISNADAEIDQTVISHNKGVDDDAASDFRFHAGGVHVKNAAFGVYGITDTSNTLITNSTITGNVAEPSKGSQRTGGGGAFAGKGTLLEVTNSTITGNVAAGSKSYGGGLAGNVRISQSTVTGNSAAKGGGVKGGDHGFTAGNSIIAGNTSTNATAGGDCEGLKFRSQGGNLIQSAGSCPLDPTDLAGVDPLLGDLRDNGGPTPTRALNSGSPAIDHGIAANATRSDQRGVKRTPPPDSGAYEFSP